MKKKKDRCFLRCPVWEQSTHHFPNQKKNLDRFKAWVEAIDRKLETDEDYEYFRTKRLCHIHFIPMYCYNNKRLSPLAIPTLYLTKESRSEYWAKDLALRQSMQSKSPDDDADITKDGVMTNNADPVMEVLEEEIPLNNTQSLLGSNAQGSLLNLLIADTLKGENENYADVQEQPIMALSVPSPVASNVQKPVANIIIEYIPSTDEVSVQKTLMNIHRNITISEAVENLPPVPDFIHDISIDSTVLEKRAEKIETNFDSVQNCIQQTKKKRRRNYDGLSWEVSIRIQMEHNYSKASIVASTSYISRNGVHPRKTIITLKSKVKELQKKLKYYKQKCKTLLRMNQERVTKQIKTKTITKLSHKGPASHQNAIKNIINYLKHKNVGCGVSLPRNV